MLQEDVVGGARFTQKSLGNLWNTTHRVLLAQAGGVSGELCPAVSKGLAGTHIGVAEADGARITARAAVLVRQVAQRAARGLLLGCDHLVADQEVCAERTVLRASTGSITSTEQRR